METTANPKIMYLTSPFFTTVNRVLFFEYDRLRSLEFWTLETMRALKETPRNVPVTWKKKQSKGAWQSLKRGSFLENPCRFHHFFQRIHGDFTIFPRRIDLKIEGKPESNLSFDYEKKHLAGVSISCVFCRRILSKWYRDVTCLLNLLLMPYCIFLREVTPKCVVSTSSFPHFFLTNHLRLGRLHAMRLAKFFAGAWRPKSSRSAGVLVGWSIIRSHFPSWWGSFPYLNLSLFQLVQLVQLVGITEVYESKHIQVHKVPVALKISWL